MHRATLWLVAASIWACWWFTAVAGRGLLGSSPWSAWSITVSTMFVAAFWTSGRLSSDTSQVPIDAQMLMGSGRGAGLLDLLDA